MNQRTKNKRSTALLVAIFVLAQGSLVVLAQAPAKTLHDRAKDAGGKLIYPYDADRSVVYPNVEELAKHSDLIIIGRTVGHRARLTADGMVVTRDFLVKTQEVIKGDIQPGLGIAVSVPGGSYRFPDGVYVYVRPRDYLDAKDGKLYVFFLRAKGSLTKGHQVAGGVQGLFELTDGGVQPADLVADDPVVVKYKGKKGADFLAEIHRAVNKGKKRP
ncbi:MAG TPA: hypothetical protein VJH03_23875 [Blastocatellia bacterium]|nr:hypothetical protein [Blastocatellia bacterium]